MPPAKDKKVAAKKKTNRYKMPAPIPVGEVISNPNLKKEWKLGPSIGVGGFGEIYSACELRSSPKKSDSYPFVVKVEPHENGPLFVETHFYVRNGKKEDIANFIKTKKLKGLGMPTYFGTGSHMYKDNKYRYLVMERYGKDLWNLFLKSGRLFPPVTVFILGVQMLDVLEYIHSRNYVHADLKGANILIGLHNAPKTQNQAYLVDFGLATKVSDKPFKPDPKCAHNGTIEYTSRDAHLGVPTMRGDLEILGYNMLQWLVGELPWEKSLKVPKTVQSLKEAFMGNVRQSMQQYKNVPDALTKFFEYVKTLKPEEMPDHTKCRQMFVAYLKSVGATLDSKLDFSPGKKQTNNGIADDSDTEDVPKENNDVKKKRGRSKAKVAVESDSETVTDSINKPVKTKTVRNKRKSTEPVVVVKVKKTKLTPKATPPTKPNHTNTATQTSINIDKKNPRQVCFDSPISAVLGDNKVTMDSSGDIFDDSFVIENNKVKKRRRLLKTEELVEKKVFKTRTTARLRKNIAQASVSPQSPSQ